MDQTITLYRTMPDTFGSWDSLPPTPPATCPPRPSLSPPPPAPPPYGSTSLIGCYRVGEVRPGGVCGHGQAQGLRCGQLAHRVRENGALMCRECEGLALYKRCPVRPPSAPARSPGLHEGLHAAGDGAVSHLRHRSAVHLLPRLRSNCAVVEWLGRPRHSQTSGAPRCGRYFADPPSWMTPPGPCCPTRRWWCAKSYGGARGVGLYAPPRHPMPRPRGHAQNHARVGEGVRGCAPPLQPMGWWWWGGGGPSGADQP